MGKRQFLSSASGLAIALAMLSGGSGAAIAQDTGASGGIERIIVTAQKREEALQDVPLAITAFSGNFLEERNIRDIRDLTDFSPSLRYENGNTVRNSGIAVRGIGSGGGFNAGVDGSVGLYLDGIYIPKQAGLLQSLTDIQSIELLKGPQGTLYGANTPAGVLNVNTGRPTQEFEAQINLGVGNFDSREASGFVNFGVTDNVATRFAFWTRENEGWLELQTGGYSNSHSEYGGRVKTLWTPTESTEIELTADFSHIRAVCCDGEWIDISDQALATFDRMAEGLNLNRDVIFPNREGDGFMGRGEELDHVSFSQAQGTEVFDHWGVALRGLTDLGGIFEGHTLTAIASYRDFDSEQASDQDEVGIDVTLFADQPERRKTTTIEVRLSSPVDQFLEYTAGLFFLQDDGFFQQQSQLRLPGCQFIQNVENRVNAGTLEDTAAARSLCNGWGRSDQWDQDWTSYAAFAQATANLTEDFSVTLGGRVTRDEKEVVKSVRQFDAESEQILADLGINCTNCTFGVNDARVNGLGILFGTAAFEDEVSNTEITWSATAQYYLDDFIPAADTFMTYVRAATGYKAPGINARPIRFPTIPRTYNEETSTNYEIGVKALWFDNLLQTNFAVYKNNFTDLQQIAANPQADPTGAFGTFVQNAGELEHIGVEFDYVAEPLPWLSLNGGFAYLDSEYVEFEGAPCPDIGDVPRNAVIPALCDFTGLPNTQSPKWRGIQTARATFPLGQALEWHVSGSWIYTGDRFVDPDLDDRSFQESHSVFDMTAGIADIDGTWTVTAWVRNLTDEMYLTSITNGAVPGLFGNIGSKVGRFAMPRSYGVRASYNF